MKPGFNARAFRLSKKFSFCWAFSIFYDIIHIYAHQVARARAEASGVRAGAFAVLRQA